IVAVHEAGMAGSVGYLAPAFCPGPTLAEWLRGRTEPVPVRQTARLLGALADSGGHAHPPRLRHPHLQPGNAPLPVPTPRGASLSLDDFTPRVTDFGLAKVLHGGAGRTRTGNILGSPSYMPPEQAGGKNHEVGPAADVWALGAILYELLTGRPPFQAETVIET